MEAKVYIKTRNKNCYANAIYKESSITVLKGSKINLEFAKYNIHGGSTAKKYRDDRSLVDENGNVLKDCEFSSPSTAAQFVTGTSINGWLIWHIDKHTTLKKFVGKD